MEQKAFYQALIDINIDPSKTKKCLDDKRPTYAEKRILESYLLIRNNQNKEALEMMRSLAPTGLPFVEAQKDLLIGLSLNNQSIFIDAEASISKAIPVFTNLKSDYFLFMCYFNLALIHLNTSQLDKMKSSVESMSHLSLETKLQKIRLLRCQFAYYSESGYGTEARDYLSKIETLKPEMPESDIISQLLCEFRFFIAEENFSKCEAILDEMKNFRKFHLSENYNFMKKLLSHVSQNTPLYAYSSDFESVPLLKHQISVIKSLEELNQSEAKDHWIKLQKLAPDMFQDNFVFNGRKCLFSLCLNKHLNRSKSLNIKKKEERPQLDALIELLEKAEGPLQKGFIYEFLWNTTPESKDDFKKLTRLIYRARIERGIEVLSRKGTYYIENKKKKLKTG